MIRSHKLFAPTAALVLLVILAALILLSARLGLADSTWQVVWSIRAPRILLAVLVGLGLGVAGTLMQGSLGNPLADPGIVGVSGGAALGTVIAAVLGLSFGSLPSSVLACLGAGVAMAVIVSVSVHHGKPEVVTLLLAGVAVTAFTGAAVALISSISSDAGVRSVSFWSTGSFALANWGNVAWVGMFIAAGILVALLLPKQLDVLSLGDKSARAAGINVTMVRHSALVAVILLVAAGVANAGVIAFVGLLVPHAVRMLTGPSHGRLIILSGLTGAVLLLAADTAARTLAGPVEIPVGAVTALVGAPVFFLLLRRTKASQGGWA